MKKLYRNVAVIAAVYAVPLLCSCTLRREQPQTFTVMGTVCTVNLFEDGTPQHYRRIKNMLVEMEHIFSANSETSELANVNRNAGIDPVPADAMLLDVVRTALSIAHETDGAFNPAIGPLVKLWNIGFESAALPPPEEIARALSYVDMHSVVPDEKQKTLFLAKKNTALDLGGIAKGAAADRISLYLASENIKKAIVDLGGNILLFGEKAPDTPWVVGIKNPAQPSASPVIKLELTATSIVTSGIYERFFVAENGTPYHHLLDPATGYPAENNLMSVTVITPRSVEADGLSTALFIMGLQNGFAFIETRPDADAIFITRDKKIYATPRVRPVLQILNPGYSLADFSPQ